MDRPSVLLGNKVSEKELGMMEEFSVLTATSQALAQRFDDDADVEPLVEDVSLVLAGGSPLLQSGILAALQREGRIKIVHSCVDIREATNRARQRGCDVFVVYSEDPVAAAMQVTDRLADHQDDTRVVVLTDRKNSFDMVSTLREGVAGYGVMSNLRPEDLCAGVLAVSRGGGWLCPIATRNLIEVALLHPAPISAPPLPPGADVDLSDRELQVLRLVAQGDGEQQISEALFISRNTVKTYIRRICEKFGVGSRSDAVRFAIQHKLIPDRRTRMTLAFPTPGGSKPLQV